jgi:hypothetical protein
MIVTQISATLKSREAENAVAIIDDLLTMGYEDHCMIRETGGETLHQCNFGLRVKGRAEFIQKEDAAGTQESSGNGNTLGLSF